MNTVYGIIILIGLFSNLTGYFIGYIRGKVRAEAQEKKGFASGYRKAFKQFAEFEPLDVSIEEAYFTWKNRLELEQQKETYHH